MSGKRNVGAPYYLIQAQGRPDVMRVRHPQRILRLHTCSEFGVKSKPSFDTQAPISDPFRPPPPRRLHPERLTRLGKKHGEDTVAKFR